MPEATSAECSHKGALSPASTALYAADICALQYRLSRCLQTVTPLLSSTPESSSHAAASAHAHSNSGITSATSRHIRRLGDLLREATQLTARIAETEENSPLKSMQASSLSRSQKEECTSVTDPLQAFYDQQLQARFMQMLNDMTSAQHLLELVVTATPGLAGLPVNCVGSLPHNVQSHSRNESGEVSFFYADKLTPRAARVPAAVLHCIPSATPTTETPMKSHTTPSSSRGDQQVTAASPAHHSAAPTSSEAATPTAAPATAEERIMADIQQAIHQIKDGALQMSAMMEQERAQMKSAADLLSGGVAKTHANMTELDRVSYVGAASRPPWLLSCVPGMPLLWRTVLQPMWAFLKQVLLMAAVIAVTAGVLLVITVVPKPINYRGKVAPHNVPSALVKTSIERPSAPFPSLEEHQTPTAFEDTGVHHFPPATTPVETRQEAVSAYEVQDAGEVAVDAEPHAPADQHVPEEDAVVAALDAEPRAPAVENLQQEPLMEKANFENADADSFFIDQDEGWNDNL